MPRILVLAALPLLGAAPAVQQQQQPRSTPSSDWTMPNINPQPRASASCPETPMSVARGMVERPEAQPLNRLPDAQVFAAVDRRMDGCPAPMLLSEARGR